MLADSLANSLLIIKRWATIGASNIKPTLLLILQFTAMELITSFETLISSFKQSTSLIMTLKNSNPIKARPRNEAWQDTYSINLIKLLKFNSQRFKISLKNLLLKWVPTNMKFKC